MLTPSLLQCPDTPKCPHKCHHWDELMGSPSDPTPAAAALLQRLPNYRCIPGSFKGPALDREDLVVPRADPELRRSWVRRHLQRRLLYLALRSACMHNQLAGCIIHGNMQTRFTCRAFISRALIGERRLGKFRAGSGRETSQPVKWNKLQE